MNKQERIIRYWHAVELLQPQSAPKLSKRDNPYSAFIHDTPIGQPIPPWSQSSIVAKQQLPKRRVWSHTLFAHLYDSRRIAEHLNKVYGADEGYKEPQYRESALFSAKFTAAGQLVDDSLVISSEVWFLGRVLSGKDWTRGFEDDRRTISDGAKAMLEGQISGEALRTLTCGIIHYLGVAEFFGDIDSQAFRFRSQPVNPDKPEQEDDALNSFLLDDLVLVADKIGNVEKSEPLDQYLHQHDMQKRCHVDQDQTPWSLIEHLMPDAYAMSCWPSEQHLGLVHSQQLAVNTILAKLGEGQGLLGVNGPPGTGKTTLLRDLIASIVASRADVLSRLNRASDGFISDGREVANDGGRQQACFKLNSALYGFEIVVASSNNGAVENITLELPQRNKIDESWLPEVEYFADLGELVSGKPAWGLISGALGSKARRTKFVESYFFGQRPFGSNKNMPFGSEDESESADEFGDTISALFSTPSTEAPDLNKGRTEIHSENKEGPKGFLGWLNSCAEVNKTRSPEQRQALWQQAITDYKAAKKEERKASASVHSIRELIQALSETAKTIAAQSEKVSALKKKLDDTTNKLSHLDVTESRPASIEFKHCLDAFEKHLNCKPGFWVNVFSLWGAQRDWNVKRKRLESQRYLAESEFTRIARCTKQLEAARESLDEQMVTAQDTLHRLRDKYRGQFQNALNTASNGQAVYLRAWLQKGKIGRSDAIELAEPWVIEGWRQARARVFIEALKLHRMFFELEASRIRSNLFLINGVLTGTHYQGFSRDALRSAWASLFMVVPVLSSTFASFARSFGSLGTSEIGWLLVDEAGQTPPQAAVGALWRARRALFVGDPLQLKPITTISDAVLEHMRTHYQVDTHWLPNRQSAQTLADEATNLGRMAGPANSKAWVGLPLIVHRRCDTPMHALANRIAYDGAMVYGTLAPHPDKETPASLPTGWIQASGASQGNWVPAEGQALQKLLAMLQEDGVEAKDISVITPFKTVQQNLKRMLGKKIVCGTIHTMQGKEAPIVIMVLGGNTQGPGARNWAVSEPNLLNVAATRAKRRFYVIGDRNDWKNRALFCDLMDLLPLQTIPVRKQEKISFPQ